MPTVVITGASRGLGFEFAKQYRADGWTVIATCRDPAKADALKALGVRIEALDVDSAAQTKALAAKLAGEPIDLLILNAGIYGPRTTGYQDLDEDAWAQVLKTNVMAPLRFAAAMADTLAKGGMKKLAFVSSRMGSIGANDAGGAYIYRSSKAALNAVIKSFALDTKEKGLTSISLHPGWVQTDMGGPSAAIDPTTSVTGMRAVIAKAQNSDNGSFFNYDGEGLPW
jgi:NAD(P)-dependent dehydrogenase (short-subunit alcohol dehydrogenase family)